MVPPFLKQLWAVSAVLFNMCAMGMQLSFPSCLLPALRHPDSDIKADLNIGSWLASCTGLANIPGTIVASYMMGRIGRKVTHGLLLIPGVISCVLIYQASSITMLMIGRILGGFATGGTVSLGAVVIGEYTSPKYRGMFLNLKTAIVCFGSMIIHIFGNFLHWRTVALTISTPQILAILITLTWPESPAWLATRKKFQKCKDSFFWLRGNDENASKELEHMIKAHMSSVDKDFKYKDAVKEFCRKFTMKDFLKPLGILLVGFVLLEASGKHFFPANALDIINEVTGDKYNTFYYTLIIDIIITASTILSSFLVTICPKRTLLFSSGFAAVIMIGIICGYLFLMSRGFIAAAHPAIPMAMFVIYFILINLGCSPIPLSFVGELFPVAHRATGAMLSGFILAIFVYIGLKITPYLLVTVKVYGTFTVYGVTAGLCLLILYFILPETKDRTLQEIEDYFNEGRFRDEINEEVKLKMLKEGP